MEMRCYRRLLHISYKDHITNAIVCNKIQTAIGSYEEILNNCEKGNYGGSDIVVRSNGWGKGKVASAKRSYKAQYQGKEGGI